MVEFKGHTGHVCEKMDEDAATEAAAVEASNSEEGEMAGERERERVMQLFSQAQAAFKEETDRREVTTPCACVDVHLCISVYIQH